MLEDGSELVSDAVWYYFQYSTDALGYDIVFPFVGYAADLQVGEGAYVMWMVCDNSKFSKLASLEEGTIEKYALKMAESLKISED